MIKANKGLLCFFGSSKMSNCITLHQPPSWFSRESINHSQHRKPCDQPSSRFGIWPWLSKNGPRYVENRKARHHATWGKIIPFFLQDSVLKFLKNMQNYKQSKRIKKRCIQRKKRKCAGIIQQSQSEYQAKVLIRWSIWGNGLSRSRRSLKARNLTDEIASLNNMEGICKKYHMCT